MQKRLMQLFELQGTTGSSALATSRMGEKVDGKCKDCGYKFKPKDV